MRFSFALRFLDAPLELDCGQYSRITSELDFTSINYCNFPNDPLGCSLYRAEIARDIYERIANIER